MPGKWLIGIVVLGSLSGWVRASDDVEVAQAQVTVFHEHLLTMVQRPDTSARATYIRPHVAALFDVPRIAAISLGRTWRELDEAAQAAFVDLQTELIAATYADRFGYDAAPRFSIESGEAMRAGIVVRARLDAPDGRRVTLDYLSRDGRVFNVVADGVSDLALRRSEYSEIVQRVGFDGLVADIRSRVRSMQGQSTLVPPMDAGAPDRGRGG